MGSSNKKRLYIALYPTGAKQAPGERKYHWALLVGPKKEEGEEVPGMRYHAKNTQGNAWQYEETGVRDVKSTNLLLVRVLIAKVVDEERLAQVMRSVHQRRRSHRAGQAVRR
ncbi:hypothetical protein RB597_006283 [Gaeumannomyces tritici]